MTKLTQEQCCADCRADIPWYVNGTLSDRAAGILREHLKSCGECRSDFELHAEMRGSVLGRELTPMKPATRAEDIIGADNDIHDNTVQRSSRGTLHKFAIAAGIAVLGIALVLGLYPLAGTRTDNQVFETATSTVMSDGIDYVLQLQFDASLADSERARIAEKLEGAVKWTVDDQGIYDVHVRLDSPTLQNLREYEKRANAQTGVQSAKFTALQLPMR